MDQLASNGSDRGRPETKHQAPRCNNNKGQWHDQPICDHMTVFRTPAPDVIAAPPLARVPEFMSRWQCEPASLCQRFSLPDPDPRTAEAERRSPRGPALLQAAKPPRVFLSPRPLSPPAPACPTTGCHVRERRRPPSQMSAFCFRFLVSAAASAMTTVSITGHGALKGKDGRRGFNGR